MSLSIYCIFRLSSFLYSGVNPLSMFLVDDICLVVYNIHISEFI